MKVDFKTKAGVKVVAEGAFETLRAWAEMSLPGAVLRKEGGSYDPMAGTFTFKVTFVAPGEGGVASKWAKEEAAYRAYAKMEGLPEDGLGKAFTYNGKPAKILGFLPRRSKFTVLAEVGGKVVCLPAIAVQKALGVKPDNDDINRVLMESEVPPPPRTVPGGPLCRDCGMDEYEHCVGATKGMKTPCEEFRAKGGAA